MPPMVTLVDIVEQLEQIDQQIISLLEERVRLSQQGEGLDNNQESDLFSAWLEESADHGLDEEKMDKMGRLIAALSRQVVED